MELCSLLGHSFYIYDNDMRLYKVFVQASRSWMEEADQDWSSASPAQSSSESEGEEWSSASPAHASESSDDEPTDDEEWVLENESGVFFSISLLTHSS